MAEVGSELFKSIRRIQIQTTHLAEDVLAGAYKSAFRGRGIEFEEVKDYQPGDDIRSIDWNVTARMNHPYVKSFREERELTVMLVVDISASSRFGSTNQTKAELIAEIAAVLAFSAIKNNDKVGLILFSEEVEKYLAPKKGTRHVLQVIREILAYTPKKRGTNLGEALAFLGKVSQRSGICFVISDFLCEQYAHEMTLIAQKHDLITISVNDPFEKAIPSLSLVTLSDLETGGFEVVDTSYTGLQNYYQKASAQRLQEHHNLMNKIGADYIEIQTGQPYLKALKNFFKIRGRKRR